MPASQATKLGLKPGLRVAVLGRPGGWDFEPGAPPLDDAGPDGPADLVVAFVRSAAELADVAAWGARIRPAGALWVAWPRRAAGHVSDVTDNGVRAAALPLGLVDNKVAMLDEDWSSLRLVWRLSER